MKLKTWTSAGLLALSGAAIAQVSTAPDPKLGNPADSANGQAGNAAGFANASSGNDSDPGKP